MKTLIALALTIIVLSSASSCIASDKEYLDYYLNIKDKSKSELAAYKETEESYIKLKSAVIKNDASSSSVKYFLFIGYAAYQRNDAATIESLNEDMMLVYLNNEASVLSSLRELPEFVNPTCRYLGKYFGFEDKHKGESPEFIATHLPQLESILGKDRAESCVAEIEKYSNQ